MYIATHHPFYMCQLALFQAIRTKDI